MRWGIWSVKRGNKAAVTAGLVAAVSLLAGCGCGTEAAVSATGTASPQQLAQVIRQIEDAARYRQSDWVYEILDQSSGQVLAMQNAQKMFDPGSTMKLYSVSTALRLYGTGYRFRTPVYREGAVSGGTLRGNLVLVASGDVSLGLREQRNGTLYYESLPKANQSYANQLPGRWNRRATRLPGSMSWRPGCVRRGSPGGMATWLSTTGWSPPSAGS